MVGPDPLAGERSYVEEYECFLYPDDSCTDPVNHARDWCGSGSGRWCSSEYATELLRWLPGWKALSTIPF